MQMRGRSLEYAPATELIAERPPTLKESKECYFVGFEENKQHLDFLTYTSQLMRSDHVTLVHFRPQHIQH
jgi:hypothetical protein